MGSCPVLSGASKNRARHIPLCRTQAGSIYRLNLWSQRVERQAISAGINLFFRKTLQESVKLPPVPFTAAFVGNPQLAWVLPLFKLELRPLVTTPKSHRQIFNFYRYMDKKWPPGDL